MRCGACGYRYKEMEDENFCDDYKEVSDGVERFEKLEGCFNYENGDFYICPKCGTAKMEKH
jgi:hypothetical protein